MGEEFTFADMPEEFTGVRINPKDCLGHLLLIWAIDYLPDKPTQFSRPDKPSDVVVVDVVDLDVVDPDTGEQGLLARHTWWRQAKLIQRLKTMVGNPNPLLAVMAKGGASQGYNAPFVLNDASSDQGARQRASEWLTRNPGHRPSTPFEAPQGPSRPLAHPAQAPAPVSSADQAQETLLERLARQAQQGRDRLPAPPGQGPVPF